MSEISQEQFDSSKGGCGKEFDFETLFGDPEKSLICLGDPPLWTIL